MGFDTDTLDVAFEAAYDSTTGGDLKNEVKNVGDTTGPITIDLPKDTYQFMIGIDATGNYILRKINKLGMQYGSWNLRNTEKIYYILKDKYEVDLQAEIKWTGDPATVIYPNTRSLATKVKAARIKVAGVGMSMRAKYLHGITPQQQIIGCGLQTEEKRLKIDTMKISSMPKETQLKTGKHTPNFGNYCVSLKNLKRGFLTISYPSGSVVSLFPKTLISNTLRRIINDIIFEKSFDEKDYASLEEDEKKLFDDLLTYTRADNKSIVELYRHKKYNDESRDADVKRFNLLKGQLVAGNTNPELLKELKVLLFRLYDERVILLRDFQKLLAQLVAIC
jgi:hypothetical protein